jgi:two-component system phosphate regulon response regulator OmpR
VLVVDDDPSIRLLCRVNLQLEDFRVAEAASLAEARAALEGDDFDVLLLDVHVGADHGLELLNELEARESGIRIALLTGTAELDPVAVRLADAVIAKPFTLERLIQTVRGLANVGCSI